MLTSHRGQKLNGDRETLGFDQGHHSHQQWTLSNAGDSEYFITNHQKEQLSSHSGEVGLREKREHDETWRISDAGQGKVFLRASDGKFLQDHYGNLRLTENADAWEKWSIASIGGNAVCRYPDLTLFCFTVTRSGEDQFKLVRKQQELGAGIFGCDEVLVLSDVERQLGKHRTTFISHNTLSHKEGKIKNSDLFLEVWHKVKVDGRYKTADWTIKADADTVFFPDRLRARLGGKSLARTYSTFFANCEAKVDVQAKEHPRFMYGPLEVFSVAAVEKFFSGTERCKKEVGLGKTMWEERFITHCLELLGTKLNPYRSLHLLSDPHCDNTGVTPDCTGSFAAFHNFSNVEAYTECWTTAKGAHVVGSEANEIDAK